MARKSSASQTGARLWRQARLQSLLVQLTEAEIFRISECRDYGDATQVLGAASAQLALRNRALCYVSFPQGPLRAFEVFRQLASAQPSLRMFSSPGNSPLNSPGFRRKYGPFPNVSQATRRIERSRPLRRPSVSIRILRSEPFDEHLPDAGPCVPLRLDLTVRGDKTVRNL
jgi:hypothetical protein